MIGTLGSVPFLFLVSSTSASAGLVTRYLSGVHARIRTPAVGILLVVLPTRIARLSLWLVAVRFTVVVVVVPVVAVVVMIVVVSIITIVVSAAAVVGARIVWARVVSASAVISAAPVVGVVGVTADEKKSGAGEEEHRKGSEKVVHKRVFEHEMPNLFNLKVVAPSGIFHALAVDFQEDLGGGAGVT